MKTMYDMLVENLSEEPTVEGSRFFEGPDLSPSIHEDSIMRVIHEIRATLDALGNERIRRVLGVSLTLVERWSSGEAEPDVAQANMLRLMARRGPRRVLPLLGIDVPDSVPEPHVIENTRDA